MIYGEENTATVSSLDLHTFLFCKTIYHHRTYVVHRYYETTNSLTHPFLGVVAAGGVYTTASPASTPAALAMLVRDTGPARLLVCRADNRDMAVSAAEQAGIPFSHVLILESYPEVSLQSADGSVRCDFTSQGDVLSLRTITDPGELARTSICLIYSSGTTYGFQKDGGIVYWMTPPKGGSAAGFDMAAFLRLHEPLAFTSCFTAPSIYEAIARCCIGHGPGLVSERTLSALRVAYSGGSRLRLGGGGFAGVRELIGDPSGGRPLLISQTWSATETTGAVTHMLPDRAGWGYSEECWQLPNVRMRLVDDEGQDVPLNMPGEALLKGPGVMMED
ncbi:hypothetical protein Daus18300_005478 [Diaporthe australafricana]|uniref:AMP-dependent synthetase/ligase domain-containing protein n=1 Tax=Diaporthe australafricana TaxID=127596 RepID=A0ABR3X1S1_9PEZI